jgi:hypothetical protein
MFAYFVLASFAFTLAGAGHGPADLDRDGDVDLLDFAALQACATGAGTAQIGPACQVARIDEDGDVDAADLVEFADCISGAAVPACAECTPQGYPFFPRGAIWYQDISFAPLDPQSDEVIAWLAGAGGWGTGVIRIDYSIEVLFSDAETPRLPFIRTGDWFYPDCDWVPVPIPAGGALEGESGYECVHDGDCHLIVAHEPLGQLFEMWRANIVAETFYGGCLAVWDMSRVYGPAGRGENCTSADAAGCPIAPLLFTADEVASGWIDHAIRFILPNSRIRNGEYLHPATHSTGATSGPPAAPAYGARLRLRADYPVEALPTAGARVVARAMQRYGMFLADGGNIALTAQSDRFTAAKWDGLLGTRDLAALVVSDFELIDGGAGIPYTGDCVREPARRSGSFSTSATSSNKCPARQ